MKKFTKLISSILIVMLLFNFLANMGGSIVFADEQQATTMTSSPEEDEDFANANAAGARFWTGVGGVLASILNGFIMLPGIIVNTILKGLGRIGGVEDVGNDSSNIGLFHIFFNKLGVTDINILEFNWGSAMNKSFKTGEDGENKAFYELRKSIANWYYGIRNLALIILLCVLIYVGIKMATSTIADDQAKYKTMLKDWFVALVLVFVLQYVILIVINLNNVIVSALEPMEDIGVANLRNYENQLFWQAFGAHTGGFVRNISSGIIYVMLSTMTFGFLLTYIKRMITIAFLTLIAPIITITYPIDKMGDGKSQALNTWLKEFMYNVLIQPFHCILYLVFVSTALELIQGSLASGIFAILIIRFIYEGEKIIKKIFGFGEASTLGEAVKSAAMIGASAKFLSNLGKKGKDKDEKDEGDKKGADSGATGQTSNQAQNNSNAANSAGNTQSSGTGTNNNSGSGGTNNNSGSGGTRSAKPQTFRRRLAGRAGKLGKGAARNVGRAAFAIGGIAAGAGGGGNLAQMTAAGAATGIIGGKAIDGVAGGVRNMSAAKKEGNFKKQYSEAVDNDVTGGANTKALVNDAFYNYDDIYDSLDAEGKKLANSVNNFKRSLEKLGYEEQDQMDMILADIAKVDKRK